MPALKPELYEELVTLCAPLFRLPEDRDARLLIPLSKWPGFLDIEYSGSGRIFTIRLVYILPAEQLKTLLRYLVRTDNLDEAHVATLCDEIDADVDVATGLAINPLEAYHQGRVQEWSAPRYQLDSHFVQLTLLLDQGPDAQGTRFIPDVQAKKYDSLGNLLANIKERSAVVLGPPGSGKTTLLRRLQLEHAWAELEASTGQVSFFASLNAYVGAGDNDLPPDPGLWLAEQWHKRHQVEGLPSFDTLFRGGRLLLLLDGLNEMPHRDRGDYWERVGRWRSFLQQTMHYGNIVVFSCRSLNYSASLGSEDVPVRQVQVEPLTESQIEQFLTRYLAEERGASVMADLRRSTQRIGLYTNPFWLLLLVEELVESQATPQGHAALLTSFVRRSLRREVEHRHPLFQPNALLSEDDVRQLNQRLWANPFDLAADGLLIQGLESLAFKMQAGRQSQEAGQVRVTEQTALEMLAHSRARDVLEAGFQLNILDKDLRAREITFYHQLIQEYFAARVLARAPEPNRLTVEWHVNRVTPTLADTVAKLNVSDPLPPLPATGWEETTVLTAAMAGSKEQQEQFVADLISHNLPLAARCAIAPEVTVSPALKDDIRRLLLARIADPQADLRARIAAAEALGDLDDPRFERHEGLEGKAYLLPPLVPIAGGTYTIGDDQGEYERERPAHQVEVTAFEMGQFPVTNAEYRLFMGTKPYADERWWDTEAARAWRRGEGSNEGPKAQWRLNAEALRNHWTEEKIEAYPNWTPEQKRTYLWFRRATAEEQERQLEEWYPTGIKYQQPEYWEDSRFNHAARPVVGVTWYEARAYCAWLSAQTGDHYDLPTEAEWEAAVRGKAGRLYAYEGSYDAAKCNTFETHIRATTPVGVFPHGQTPEGIYDLTGNVWEWTSTIYWDYPYKAADGREAPEAADPLARRVLRGGSWGLDQLNARAVYRAGDRPDGRGSLVGLRVVRRRRPPSQNDH